MEATTIRQLTAPFTLRMTFDEFFRRATGHAPYAYQRRLAALEVWPDALHVPTGAGKTAAALLGWLWRRRFAAESVRRATGRRLVFCLPMRTLTTQTAEAATRWLERLALPDAPTVHVVMGGDVDDEWLGAPEREAILVGTQDLLLSRALNRGFAMNRYAWPMAFGLLHNDVQWVFDEVQLMGVGASTSAQLDALRARIGAVGPAHSLWMSATLEPGRLRTVDRQAAPQPLTLTAEEATELAPLLQARKALAPLSVDAADVRAVASAVAERHVPGTRTLVVVNTVRRAKELYRALGRTMAADLALLHARFRPADRAAIEARVFDPAWHGVLVATQVVEAGVDISARTLVTELAPWSSLVQRFGRCNRKGEFTDASILWLALDERMAAPYEAEALQAAADRLHTLTDGSAERLAACAVEPGTVALPVLRRVDLLDLFDTTPDLSGADLDVSMYIRDGDDTDVFVAWREWDGHPTAPSAATALPAREECCRVSVSDARELLKRLHGASEQAWRFDHREGAWVPATYVVPGHLWIVPASAGGYSSVLGLDITSRDPVAVVMPPQPLPPAEGDGDDPRTASRAALPLAAHTDHVVASMQALLRSLEAAVPEPWTVHLTLAARWHDVGKAHDVFQQTLHGGPRGDGPLLAKARATGRHHARRGFRHEVASALAVLAHHPDAFPVAYLVAAHHGRARLVVRARPGEPPPPDRRAFALGVWAGDVLPVADLGGGVAVQATALDPEVFALGGTGASAGWTSRAVQLRDEHGPFRLAYFEALLRAADWRASASEEAP